MTFKEQKLKEFEENKTNILHLSETNSDGKLWVLKSDVKDFLSSALDEYEARVKKMVENKKTEALKHPMITYEGVEEVQYNIGYDSALSNILSALNLHN